MSKIYLHYDGERGPGHTFIWRQARGLPSTGRSLGEALEGFIESYYRKHGRGAYDEGIGAERWGQGVYGVLVLVCSSSRVSSSSSSSREDRAI